MGLASQGWTRRVRIDLDTDQIEAGADNLFYTVTAAWLTTAVKEALSAEARSDGLDIRFSTDLDGNDLVNVYEPIEYAAAKGSELLRIVAGPFDDSTTTLYMWWGNAAASRMEADPYPGTVESHHSFSGDDDWTRKARGVNENNLTPTGSITLGDTSGTPLGTGTAVSDTDNDGIDLSFTPAPFITAGNTSSNRRTVLVLASLTDPGGNNVPLWLIGDDSVDDDYLEHVLRGGGGNNTRANNGTSRLTADGSPLAGTWGSYHVYGLRAGATQIDPLNSETTFADCALFLDDTGPLPASLAPAGDGSINVAPSTTDPEFGGNWLGQGTLDGVLADTIWYSTDVSDATIQTMARMMLNPASMVASVGEPETVSRVLGVRRGTEMPVQSPVQPDLLPSVRGFPG